MKKAFVIAVIAAAVVLPEVAEARRVVRTAHGRVVVRRSPVIRVTPRVHLATVTYRPVIVPALPDLDRRVWSGSENLKKKEGWVDFTVDPKTRGERIMFEVDRGPAEMELAEIVFDNGEAQMVDFRNQTYRQGIYQLLDFKDGRKIDSVRIIARAEGQETVIRIHVVA